MSDAVCGYCKDGWERNDLGMHRDPTRVEFEYPCLTLRERVKRNPNLKHLVNVTAQLWYGGSQRRRRLTLEPMTKVEIEIEKLRCREGSCRNEAYQLGRQAEILRAQELVYREAWQALAAAHEKDAAEKAAEVQE